jgi:hypothetical protein
MSTVHKFVAAADIPAKGQMVTCPHYGQHEIWTHEEIQDHGLCRQFLYLEGGSCPVCKELWEGRPENGFPRDILGACLGRQRLAIFKQGWQATRVGKWVRP